MEKDYVSELVGAVDEAQANIGLLYEMIFDATHYNYNNFQTYEKNHSLKKNLKIIINELDNISYSIKEQKDKITPGIEDMIKNLSNTLNSDFEPLVSPALPIGNKGAAQACISKAIVKRLQRLLTNWDIEYEYIRIDIFLCYLSDYLLILAEYLKKFMNKYNPR
jgi:cob(I)alamin adenosyltransferase